MSGRAPRRPVASAPIRRTRRVKRASAGLSPIRAGAALAMLLSAAAVYGVGASSAFEFRELEVEGAVYTDVTDVGAIVNDVRGQNLFRLSTVPLADALRELPTVADARIRIELPGTLSVALEERPPILIWRVGERRYLADEAGTLVARLDAAAPPPEATDLPSVADSRAGSAGLSVGMRLDPVDVDAATRLASLRPADVGSRAERLVVVVTDEHGFELRAQPGGWTAIFGFYTASLRRTDIIPGQVRLLGELLEGREADVASIVLADEQDGTYVPRPTPEPSSSPAS